MLTDEFLLGVTKPARYTGGEWNSVVKGDGGIDCSVALCFPDLYEVGMSHLGLKILYSVLNDRADVACERSFAPWHDMEKAMREKGVPLFSLETKRPLKEFDIIGFSLQYELSYTNILNMLDLSGVPLFSKDRDNSHPLIVGGGPCAFNPEPLADFFDCFIIGEAEEALPEVVDTVIENKKTGRDRHRLLERLASLEGVYVPSIPKKVKKRMVADLDAAPFPEKPVVPFIDIVHDRIQIEIMRGCRRACNFCQACAIYGPNRFRSPGKILSLAEKIYKNTGYDEISLVSLSSGDHPQIMEIITSLTEAFKGRAVSISFPSLRVEEMTSRFPLELTSGRRTGLTFAPEVGSDKMRKSINKNIPPEVLKECAYQAFKNNWRRIKLYFMIGLPGEEDSDLDAIVDLAREVSETKKRVDGKPADINASVSVFIPKPHTRFEREAMLPADEVYRRQRYIREKARRTRVKFIFHDAKMSYLESVFARGDRDLSGALYLAWKNGCRFDSWKENFDLERWLAAFREAGINPDRYSLRERELGENLPWGFIAL
ncbi:MAG: TIGR03960 family B12-binding radical SAM protein [Candidatus Omnitrophica bacterium]|nr:TIGR03960 family B12-binding radical SAM protein [Candidatus Omnitrophota bacterium]